MEGSRTIELSRHAERRSHDRSIPEVARWALLEFAKPAPAGKGAVSYSFDNKTWKEVERFFGPWSLTQMQKLRRVYMVVANEGMAITIAYRD